MHVARRAATMARIRLLLLAQNAADEPSHSYAYALRPTRAEPLHIGDGGSTVDRRRGTRALI